MTGMRVFGFGSGMDIDKMVSDMMKAERAKRSTKLEREKQTITWKQEIFQDINKDLANFVVDARKNFDLSAKMVSGSTYTKSYEYMDWVKKASSTDEDVLTATATSKAQDGSYKLNVTKLAKGVNKNSTASISESDTDDNDKLYNQFSQLATTDNIEFTITTTDENNETVTKSFSFDLDKNDADPENDYTLDDIITEINKSDLNINVSYDSNFDRVFINSKTTGANVSLKIEDNSSIVSGNDFFSDILKVNIDDDPSDGAVETAKGENLEFTLGEGTDATNLTNSSNTFTINGMNITAKNLGTSTIRVESDVDAVYDKIKGFVDNYNELIGKINSKLTEKINRDYQPLTDEEKESLTEDQIKKWEEMAKSGLVKNNKILEGILSNTRMALYDTVDNTISNISHLTDIGIDTGKYSEKGKLEIDDFELKQAIADDASGVMDLLFKTSDSGDEDTKYKESGLITRVFDSITSGMEQIIEKAGPGNDVSLLKQVKSTILIDFTTGNNYRSGSVSLLGEDFLDVNQEIYQEENRLARLENRYYSKFTAMEKALSQMNNQSNWIASQLGGM